MTYKLENIEATTLPDAWFQAVYKCIETGREFTIDRGSYEGHKRLEFDYITILVKHPEIRPLIPDVPEQYHIPNPVAEGYLEEYLPYLMTNELKEGEAYTYGQRITWNNVNETRTYELKHLENIVIQDKEVNEDCMILCKTDLGVFLNQVELCIWTYKNKGYRNNQMVLQVAMPSDMLLRDPPCLRHIQVRVQDERLIFIVYFRSWDVWGGFPANLAAIQLLKEYMAGEIGIEPGVTVASSAGLHLYKYVWELGECIRGKTIEEFRKG